MTVKTRLVTRDEVRQMGLRYSNTHFLRLEKAEATDTYQGGRAIALRECIIGWNRYATSSTANLVREADARMLPKGKGAAGCQLGGPLYFGRRIMEGLILIAVLSLALCGTSASAGKTDTTMRCF